MRKRIVRYLKNQNGILKVILFGSRASNSYRDNSDYDLCIIVRKMSIKEEIIFNLGEIMVKSNIVIHPFIFTKDEYEYKVHMNIYKTEIFNNGIILIDNMKSIN